MSKADSFEGLPSELADALIESQWPQALGCTEQLLAQSPADARLWFVRGVLLRLTWRMDEAIAAHRRSIELGYAGLGPYREIFQHLEKRGEIGAALRWWRAAFERGYSTIRFHSMALDARLKDADTTSAELLDLHRDWAARYAQPDPDVPPFRLKPFDPSRPLRVGYVCSFWEAPTIRFLILPLLKRHDRKRVQAYLYVNGALRSGETWRELYEPHAVAVREVDRLSDRAFVELTRADDLDVLIELNGHSAAPRYTALASRCAPVQAVYLNYTSTTAVQNVDYIIGDRWAPPAGSDPLFTEQIERLPGCFLCYDYRDDGLVPPGTTSPPVLRNGHITFASFGASTKISPPLIAWWAEILRNVPDAMLFIRNFELSPEDNRRALRQRFAERGIDAERLRLLGKGTRLDVVRSYDEVDIALDTYPYCGGNTTAEALWQGVPVITLEGPRFSSSYGASLLHAAGCPELIGRTSEEYVQLAVTLAQAPGRLQAYRQRLRAMVVEHGLGNADLFTPQFEAALVAMRARAGAAAR